MTSRDFADFSLRAFVRASTYGMYQRVNQKSGPSSSFMKEQTATMMGSNVATLGMRLGSMSRRINGDGHRRRLATSTISATSALSHNKRHPLVVNKPENALEIAAGDTNHLRLQKSGVQGSGGIGSNSHNSLQYVYKLILVMLSITILITESLPPTIASAPPNHPRGRCGPRPGAYASSRTDRGSVDSSPSASFPFPPQSTKSTPRSSPP